MHRPSSQRRGREGAAAVAAAAVGGEITGHYFQARVPEHREGDLYLGVGACVAACCSLLQPVSDVRLSATQVFFLHVSSMKSTGKSTEVGNDKKTTTQSFVTKRTQKGTLRMS